MLVKTCIKGSGRARSNYSAIADPAASLGTCPLVVTTSSISSAMVLYMSTRIRRFPDFELVVPCLAQHDTHQGDNLLNL